MDGRLILTQPAGYLALCVLAALVVAGVLYFRELSLRPGVRYGLAALRFTAVGLLAFLLLGPLLRSIDTRTQKPVLLIAEDRSSSVVAEVDSLRPALDRLSRKLAERYDVQRVGVGERVRALPDTTVDEATDLSALFGYAADNYPPELLGGVVLLSDGIVNQGADPNYAAEQLASPVYAVTLGDTTPLRDIAVREVLYNQIAYLGDKLEVQVDVQANNLSGGATDVAVVSVDNRGRTKRLASERITFSKQRDFRTVRFELEPTRAGVQRYRIVASPAGDERNRANNARDLYVDVLDARQQILILAAAPHPDVSALRQTLDGNKNFETRYALLGDFDGKTEAIDLVILHDLPRGSSSIAPLIAELDERNVGRWFIAGPRVDYAGLNDLQGLLSVNARRGEVNEATPKLNASFRLFSLDGAWTQRLASWPPIEVPFAEFGALTTGDVLLRQQIGRVETDYPLLTMGEVNGHKEALFAGEGLWRWRLAEFQEQESQATFDGLVLATVQYLALRQDERPFRVASAERVYTTSDNIRLQGELYNASFELVNEPDVNVRVTDAEGTDYTYLMDRVGSSYLLRAGRLPAGVYRFEASTSYGGEPYTSTGGFTVKALQLEATELTADWSMLDRLSARRGGQAVGAGQIASLGEMLLGERAVPQVQYQSVRTRPLVDWGWLLGILLLLLSAEWFVRRRVGGY